MGDAERKRAEQLVAAITRDPAEGALKELASLGADALHAMALAAESHNLSASAKDALLETVAIIARNDPATLLAHIDEAGEYEEAIVWALGFADPKLVTRSLIRLLRDPDDGVREAAARSLVRIHTPEAAQALVPAIDDRSRAVQFVTVEALHDDAFFRLPEARPRLRRLVSDPHLKDEETEMVRHAREVLAAMER